MFVLKVKEIFSLDKLISLSRDGSIGALLTSLMVTFGHVIEEGEEEEE